MSAKRFGKLSKLIVSCIIVCALFPYVPSKAEAPIAQMGTIDVTDWRFAENGSIALDGEWRFYWRQLLTPEELEQAGAAEASLIQVPGTWGSQELAKQQLSNQGYGTYQLRVRLAPEHVDHALALAMPSVATSYKLWINGKLLNEEGTVGINKDEMQPGNLPQSIYFSTDQSTLDIVIQVANFSQRKGGLWSEIHIGYAEQISLAREKSIAWQLVFAGGLLIIGLYHLILYFFRRSLLSVLYFGLACIMIFLRTMFVKEILWVRFWPSFSWELAVKIEYLSAFFGVGFFVLYAYQLYKQDASKKLTYGLFLLICLISLPVVLFPAIVYTPYMLPSQLVLLIAVAYMIAVVIKAAYRKRSGARLNLAVSLLFLASVVNDIFLYNFWIHSTDLLPYGLYTLIFSQTLILASRFSKAFREVEDLSEQLIKLNEMKDDFLVNTSHELKTPLHGIMNLLAAMREGTAGKLNETQASQIESVMAVTKRLSNLINDILDFYKLKNGELQLRRKSISIQAALQVNRQIFQHYVADRELQLVFDIPENLPPVYADEDRLMQIFYNLIGNAVKFTESGLIEVSAKREGDLVFVSVSDTGIGIPAEKQALIFQSFEQVGAAIAKEYGGTGLGLTITKRLIELQGGGLSVQSKPGEGSTFVFHLPVADKPADANTAQSYIPDNNESKKTQQNLSKADKQYTVLAVDDDATNREVLLQIFADEPCQMLLARDGAEALEILARQTDVDVVVLDVMMPKLSGYEVCERIRETYTLFELPVLLATVRHDEDDLLRGFSSGANDYLSKPFYSHELKARVQTHVKLKQSVEEMLQSEMAFLQAQIKPHFLFNALNTIVAVVPRDPKQATELLADLSDYLRSSFDFQNLHKKVPLSKELDLIDSYLKIEKARFKERLTFECDIEKGLVCSVPPLSIQPIVENAVHHGIMKRPEGGKIKLAAKHREGFVVITVQDNGVGIDPEKLQDIWTPPSAATQVGLKNIDTRLKRMFGSGLSIASEPGHGTMVTIKIPAAAQRG